MDDIINNKAFMLKEATDVINRLKIQIKIVRLLIGFIALIAANIAIVGIMYGEVFAMLMESFLLLITILIILMIKHKNLIEKNDKYIRIADNISKSIKFDK